MNCPKCGFEQEERLDCRKCGVVFSKYLAMQTEGPVVSAAAPAHVPVENGGFSEIQELRQSIRDLNRRFSEVEFERVERGQIKGELKVLDKKFQSSYDQLALRLEELEKLLSTPQAPPPVPDDARLAEVQKELVEANIDPIAARLAEIEQKVDRWERDLIPQPNRLSAEISGLKETALEPLAERVAEIDEKLLRLERDLFPPKDSLTTEILGRFEARLTDLEVKVASRSAPEAADQGANIRNRVQSLSDELAELRLSLERIPGLQQEITDLRSEAGRIWIQIQEIESRLNRLPSPASEPQPGERLEMDIRSIRDSLQEIRGFITRVTAKS